VVFCAPTTLQKKVYKVLLESPSFQNCLYHGDSNAHLKAITLMRKICNAVSLIRSKAEQVVPSRHILMQDNDPLYSSLKTVLPGLGKYIPPTHDSGKLALLEIFFRSLRKTPEKCVIVSNFTKTLDILQHLLQSLGMTWFRLDGDTEASKRQKIVDQFNSVDADTCCFPVLPT
jgi:DNA repair and recombination protein RAD54B